MTAYFSAALCLVSVAALFVSVTQAQIARGKLRADVFDRRFAIYLAHRDLIESVLSANDFDRCHEKAIVARLQAAFLFPVEVSVYLRRLEEKVFEIVRSGDLVRTPGMGWSVKDQERELDRLGAEKMIMIDRQIELVNKFLPFLAFDDRPWWIRIVKSTGHIQPGWK